MEGGWDLACSSTQKPFKRGGSEGGTPTVDNGMSGGEDGGSGDGMEGGLEDEEDVCDVLQSDHRGLWKDAPSTPFAASCMSCSSRTVPVL